MNIWRFNPTLIWVSEDSVIVSSLIDLRTGCWGSNSSSVLWKHGCVSIAPVYVIVLAGFGNSCANVWTVITKCVRTQENDSK